jgi:hypothetical protein
MESITDWKSFLQPALYVCNASGKERKGCHLCKKAIKKDEKIIEIVCGAYRGRMNFSRRFCYNCFIKVLLHIFKDDFENTQIKREVLLENLQNG